MRGACARSTRVAGGVRDYEDPVSVALRKCSLRLSYVYSSNTDFRLTTFLRGSFPVINNLSKMDQGQRHYQNNTFADFLPLKSPPKILRMRLPSM